MLETEMICLQSKSNISRNFLETSLHYCVRHKRLKMLKLFCQSLMTKLCVCRTFTIILWIIV